MQTIKIRIHLEPGVPVRFIHTVDKVNNKTLEIILLDFNISESRAVWTVMLPDRSLISGTVGNESSIPGWPDSWLCLSIPVTLHRKKHGWCPDFIISLPAGYVADFSRN